MEKPILFEKPRGVRDILPPLAARKREVEKKIAKVFSGWGYEEIQTPTFEYADTFLNGAYRDDVDHMFKFIERSGRTVVLRPDMTAPIARIVSSLLKEQPGPIRLSYNAAIFRQQDDVAGRDAEFTQAGVELIGDDSADADAEAIALAINALQAAGVEGYRLAIGQVAYLNGLFDEYVTDASVRARLAETLAAKDLVGYERLVAAEIGEERAREVLLTVPRLRGGIAVLERARELTHSPQALAAIDNLESIWQALNLHSVDHALQIDLGLFLSQHYYTGMIFEGYAPHVGFPICSGGRYDELLGKFGRPAAATGFVIGIERVLDVLEKTVPQEADTRYLLLYEDGDRYPTIGFASFLRAKRFIVTAQRVDSVEKALTEPRPANVACIAFKDHKLIAQDKLFQAMYTDFCHGFSL